MQYLFLFCFSCLELIRRNLNLEENDRMAKNTSCSTFRKIDIDQYNEDTYKEDENTESDSPPVNIDEELINLLAQGRHAEALTKVLRMAPLGSKDTVVRDSALSRVLQVLLSVRTSDIEGIVNILDPSLMDTLMKYIYRGFEYPIEGSSGILLAWHEKVFAIGGVGCIMRVLTDRKRV